MKKVFFLLMISGLLAGACSEEFLDMKPTLSLSTNNAYETEEDFLIGLTSVYATYKDMLSSYYAMAELRSDNTINQYNATNRGTGTVPYEELDEFTMTSENGVNGYWGAGLQGVYRANVLLERLDEAPDGIFTVAKSGVPKSTGNRIAAEARFARAFHYFNLVRFYGDVPLVTEPLEFIDDAFAVPRTAAADVYKQILEDVQFAVDSLPASYSAANKGRVTKGAALTLKAKVQMTLAATRDDWRDVVTTLEAITKLTPKYDLETDYKDCFDPTNKNGKESVFEVQFGETVNDNNGLVFSWFPLGKSAWKDHFGADAPGEGNGTQWNIPTRDLLNAYEPGDPRLDVSVDTVFAGTPDAVIFIDKWMKYSVDTKETPTRNPCNMPIYRFADVKLMLAEAYLRAGETGKAQTQLDDVRNRAFAPGTPPAVTVSEDAIAKERRVELAFEGHRWFDLLRTDKAQAVMAAYGGIERSDPTNAKRKEPQYKIPAAAFEVDDYELRYPVPYYEWIKNPSITTQNPGWQ